MPETSTLRLRIFDGTRQFFTAPATFLVTITDGNQTQHVRQYYSQNDVTFDLPFFDHFGDDYTVVVWAQGYKQAGYSPVELSNTYVKILDIMLVSDDPGFSFVNARFPASKAAYPFIASGVDDATGEARFDDLLDKTEKNLACLSNLGEAMSQIQLSQGTPLTYIKQMRWDPPYAPAQDRFFAWCDVELINQIKTAAAGGQFAVELNPGLFHPGSTSSWKQIQFGEANVQLTFHENDKMVINGTNCVMVEPDIDYYRDLGAHAIFEVISNKLTNSLTEPVEVYVLRWIAGRTAGIPEFAPPFKPSHETPHDTILSASNRENFKRGTNQCLIPIPHARTSTKKSRSPNFALPMPSTLKPRQAPTTPKRSILRCPRTYTTGPRSLAFPVTNSTKPFAFTAPTSRRFAPRFSTTKPANPLIHNALPRD